MLQRIIKVVAGLGVGYFIMAQVLDGMANSMSLITFSIALYSTVVFIIAYLLFLYYSKKRKVKWSSIDGQVLKVKKLKENIFLPALGVIILIWVGPILNFLKKTPKIVASESTKIIKPMFQSSDLRFKILILPFDRECDYMGVKYDIGKVISKRLEKLNEEDTLNLTTHYLQDSLDYLTFTKFTADSLLNYHNADQIIYGVYSLKSCEGSTDKICFNYYTRVDDKPWLDLDKNSDTSYHMINVSGLEPIRNGFGQESIDFIIYSIAAKLDMQVKNYKKAIEKMKKIQGFQKNADALTTIAYCYSKFSDKMFLKYNWEAFKVDPKDYWALSNLGAYYLNNKDREKGLFYLKKALAENPNKINGLLMLTDYYVFFSRDIKSAFSITTEFLRNNIRNSDAWMELGRLSLFISKIDSAEKYFRNAIALEPQSPIPFYSINDFFAELKRYDKCKDYLTLAISRFPQNKVLINKLGVVYSQLNDFVNAKKMYEQALALDSNFIPSIYNIASVYSQYMNKQTCLLYLKKAISMDSTIKDKASRDDNFGWLRNDPEFMKITSFIYVSIIIERGPDGRLRTRLAK